MANPMPQLPFEEVRDLLILRCEVASTVSNEIIESLCKTRYLNGGDSVDGIYPPTRDRASALVAQRLVADDRSIELLSSDEVADIIRDCFDQLLWDTHSGPMDDLSDEVALADASFEVWEVFQVIFLGKGDPYDHAWHQVATMHHVVAQHETTPARQLLKEPAVRDDLIRATSSPNQVVAEAYNILQLIAQEELRVMLHQTALGSAPVEDANREKQLQAMRRTFQMMIAVRMTPLRYEVARLVNAICRRIWNTSFQQ